MLRRLAVVLLVSLCAAQQPRPAVADVPPSAEPSEAEPPQSEAVPPTATEAERASERSSASVPKRRLRLGVALRATRPWSFPATVTPVLFGSALAFQVEDRFRPNPSPSHSPSPSPSPSR